MTASGHGQRDCHAALAMTPLHVIARGAAPKQTRGGVDGSCLTASWLIAMAWAPKRLGNLGVVLR